MAESAKFDWSVFSWPRILFTEVAINAGATGNINSDQLKAGRDMLIDWIAVSEDTFASGAGIANGSYINNISLNWWIHDRAHWWSGAGGVGGVTLAGAIALDNHYLCQRTTNPVALETAGRGNYQINHPVKWLYNPLQSIALEWSNPVSAAPTGALTTGWGMHGVGVMTGHRRLFAFGGNYTTNAAGAQQGVFSDTVGLGNPGDQPYLMESLAWFPIGNNWNVLNDNRVTNHLRMRVRPTQGDAWSDVPIPIIFYGVHKGQPQRVVWYKPPGGPILLRKNQQMMFNIQNGSAVNTVTQVALIGRVAPGYKDVV